MAHLPVLCYADIDSLTCSRATFHIPALIIFDHVPLRQFYIMQELHLVAVLWSSDVLLGNELQTRKSLYISCFPRLWRCLQLDTHA
jgi:hypothetical protein